MTGGAGLLGTEFCRTLAEAGAAVAVVDLNSDAAQKVAAELCNDGHRAKGFETDVTAPAAVRELVAAVVKDFGGLDILVNSAALDPKFDPAARSKGIAAGNFEDYPLEQWNAALGTGVEPQMVTITSFNEWHEGTQIEPAASKEIPGFTYLDYGPLPPDYYLKRTAYWVVELVKRERF